MGEPCCQCAAAYNRCKTDECPCFTALRPCMSPCETEKLAADCLNKPLTRCSCLAPIALAESTRSVSQAAAKTDKKSQKALKSALPFDKPCCDTLACECSRYNEVCTVFCGCKRACVAPGTPIHPVIQEKAHRPVKGCKCGKGKKACRNVDKCSCRDSLRNCSPSCKCKLDCTNPVEKNNTLSTVARQAFARPDQEQAAAVAVLVDHNGYPFRLEFTNSTGRHAPELLCRTLLDLATRYYIPDMDHIFVYLTRSPCFHQDCEPKCEVLQHCSSPTSCAKLLSVTYGQIRRQMNSVNLQMTVKFLAPYVKRGDLYTQQGVLHMMQAGIRVEPLVMKEWTGLMAESSSSKLPMTQWAEETMDRHVRQSQQYVNACRRTLGLKDSYWTSAFHDILKSTALACDQTQQRLNLIVAKLAQLDGSQNPMTTSAKSLSNGGVRGGTPADSNMMLAGSQWEMAQFEDSAIDFLETPISGVLDDEIFMASTDQTGNSTLSLGATEQSKFSLKSKQSKSAAKAKQKAEKPVPKPRRQTASELRRRSSESREAAIVSRAKSFTGKLEPIPMPDWNGPADEIDQFEMEKRRESAKSSSLDERERNSSISTTDAEVYEQPPIYEAEVDFDELSPTESEFLTAEDESIKLENGDQSAENRDEEDDFQTAVASSTKSTKSSKKSAKPEESTTLSRSSSTSTITPTPTESIVPIDFPIHHTAVNPCQPASYHPTTPTDGWQSPPRERRHHFDVVRVLLNLSGRNIAEAERREIRRQLGMSLERIRNELDDLAAYLEQTSAATPV